MAILPLYFCERVNAKVVSVIVIVLMKLKVCNSSSHENKDYCFWRYKTLETDTGNVQLNWMVDSTEQTIIFDITCETKFGMVGLGFTHDKNLSHSFDFVLGGVDQNETGFLLDMTAQFHANEAKLVNDTKQNYELLEVKKTNTSVRIKFIRKWDTGDVNDIHFDLSLVNVIWFNSITDGKLLPNYEISTMKTTYNSFEMYFMDPVINQPEMNVESWQFIQKKRVLTNKTTSYWCTLHKAKRILKEKHQIIGFKAVINSNIERNHTHHMVLYKCVSNSKSNFEPFVNAKGNECYERTKQKSIPIHLCRNYIYVWAYGGEDFFFPTDVGYPIGESEMEYYLLEVHYDNPDALSNLVFEVGLELIITNKIRKNEAGLLMTGYDISPSLVVPPLIDDMVITGHCKPSCTNSYLPNAGVHVFGVLLHSHMLGRQIKLFLNRRQPDNSSHQISYDEFFDFGFQPSRLLSRRIPLYPEDHLTLKCHYSSTDRKGVTIGGLGSHDEMCLAFVWYYPKIRNFKTCVSSIAVSEIMESIGFNNFMPNMSSILAQWPLRRSIQVALDDNLNNISEDHWNRTKLLYEEYDRHIASC